MEKLTLRSARMMKDIKIRDISEKLNISPTTWVNYENNKTKIPAKIFLDFCKITELNPNLFDLR